MRVCVVCGVRVCVLLDINATRRTDAEEESATTTFTCVLCIEGQSQVQDAQQRNDCIACTQRTLYSKSRSPSTRNRLSRHKQATVATHSKMTWEGDNKTCNAVHTRTRCTCGTAASDVHTASWYQNCSIDAFCLITASNCVDVH